MNMRDPKVKGLDVLPLLKIVRTDTLFNKLLSVIQYCVTYYLLLFEENSVSFMYVTTLTCRRRRGLPGLVINNTSFPTSFQFFFFF